MPLNIVDDNSIRFISSDNFRIEKQYCLDFLSHRIGMEFTYEVHNSHPHNYTFILPNGNQLTCTDAFFSKHKDGTDYIQESRIPKNISQLNTSLVDIKDIPVIFGENKITINNDKVETGLDILGSIFFMLSRWEEIANTKRDHYDRFPATESLALKRDFLMRPVVDEYCELVRASFEHLGFMSEKAAAPKFNIRYTCDVDHIVDPSTSNAFSLFKSVVKSFIKKNPDRSLATILKQYLRGENPYDCFDYIFSSLQKNDVEGAFYFITDGSSQRDAAYDFMSKEISELLTKINTNGFEVGLHPSFMTYQDADQTQVEFDKLRSHADQLSIGQETWGGRQHFLRWDPTKTMHNLETAELDYDSTLGYAEHVGFRTGTTHDHRLFDPINRREMNLVERPLMLMDVTLVDSHYMGYGYTEKAYETVASLKEQCALYGGNFNFLWHNSHLLLDEDKALFEYCLS